MEELRQRITRLLNAIRTEDGLRRVESVIQDVVREQAAALVDTGTLKQPMHQLAAKTAKPSKEIVFSEDDEMEDWEVALELCESILDSLDELPERAEDFAESVRDRTESIRDWIESHEDVTPAQQIALQNMESGVSRWLH